MTLEKDVKTVEELISQITQAALRQTSAYVWKRNEEGVTIVNEKVIILKVNDLQELKIEFMQNVEIPVGEDVLFALEGGTLVFKSKVLSCNGQTAYLSIPSMAKGIERRRSPRVSYKFEDRIDFEIQIKSNTTTAFLLDLSQHGMCLSLSDETVKNLRLEQKIKILRGSKGIQHTECVVKSVRVFKGATMGRSVMYAVGLEFT